MDNYRGIGLMTLAMALFAFEDLFIKLSSEQMPTGQVIMAVGLFGAVCFGAVSVLRNERLFRRDVWMGAAGLRNFGELIATSGFVTALALAPLSLVSAILQAQPLALTCFAALFMGAKVGWRRWTAIAVGFIGVMIIIRPWHSGIRPEVAWAVIGMIGLTIRDLAARRVPANVGAVPLSFSALFLVAIMGALMTWFQGGVVVPDGHGAIFLLGTMIAGTLGYVVIVAATRIGEIAVVMPFRYARLLFVIALGALVLDERPDAGVILGAVLVIGSGLYTVLREHQLRRIANANTG